MTSARRAILVSREEAYDLIGGTEVPRRYDNAGDQPRKRVCAQHGYQDAYELRVPLGDGQDGYRECCYRGHRSAWGEECRVVSAIVVIEEDA